MYLHATLTAKVGRAAQLAETVAWLAKGMESPAVQLLGAYETISGAPGQIIDIWKLRDADAIVTALESAATHPRHQAVMDRLAESLDREQLRLAALASYSPEFRPSDAADARFVHAALRVRYGQVERISAVVAVLRDVLEEHLGWRLAVGLRTVIGEFGDIFDLWEVPRERSVEDMIDEARSIPAFREAASRLPDYLEREELIVMRPTSYCP